MSVFFPVRFIKNKTEYLAEMDSQDIGEGVSFELFTRLDGHMDKYKSIIVSLVTNIARPIEIRVRWYGETGAGAIIDTKHFYRDFNISHKEYVKGARLAIDIKNSGQEGQITVEKVILIGER